MLRIKRDQLRRGVGEVAAGIMLKMPFGRDDVAHKCIERPIVRDQAPIQYARVPVVQDTPDVENDGGRPIGTQAGRLAVRVRVDQPQG